MNTEKRIVETAGKVDYLECLKRAANCFDTGNCAAGAAWLAQAVRQYRSEVK